jgi:hypothetical protein
MTLIAKSLAALGLLASLTASANAFEAAPLAPAAALDVTTAGYQDYTPPPYRDPSYMYNQGGGYGYAHPRRHCGYVWVANDYGYGHHKVWSCN